MPEVNWVQLIGGFLSGGAAGALLSTAVSVYRARRQPVGRRIDVVPVFRPSGSAGDLQAAIAVTHSDKTVTFKNLFLAEVQVVNKGNRDLNELTFGITLGDGDRCIYVEVKPSDRYHHASIVGNPVTPSSPQPEIDFVVRPFNRQDAYSFSLYVVIPEGRVEPQDIVLGSASPIRFVPMPTTAEILARAASEVALNIGPLRLGLRK
jgi:hypothetical protein